MKFAVYFIKNLRVSFITEDESIALAHLLLKDSHGQSIYNYQSINEDDDYEVPVIS